MTNFFSHTRFLSRTLTASVLLGASLTATALPAVFASRAVAQTASFSDVAQDYWARPFIERLSQEDIIAGFPDGTFKPQQPVTRAQFAAIVRKAFSRNTAVRNSRTFSDVQSKYWAASAIDRAYTTGFLSGYPDGTFAPEQRIPKAQAVISLASGLKLDPASNSDSTLSVYRDASEIPDYAKTGVAAATQRGLVVNYPNVAYLNPTDVATRADVAAFVYQALVNQNRLSAVPQGSAATAYIVNYGPSQTSSTTGSTSTPAPSSTLNGPIIARGTMLPVQLSGGNNVKLILAPTDTIQTNFEVTQAITNNGQTIIPIGSQIQGRFQPVNINGSTQGTQYFAEKLVINGVSYPVNAVSDPILPTSQQAVTASTVQGGRATAAAQALLGNILGGNNLGSLLGGVLAGSVVPAAPATTQQSNVIVVEPSRLMLRLQSDFQASR